MSGASIEKFVGSGKKRESGAGKKVETRREGKKGEKETGKEESGKGCVGELERGASNRGRGESKKKRETET